MFLLLLPTRKNRNTGNNNDRSAARQEQERNCQGSEEKHVQLQQLMVMHLLDLQQAPLHKTIFPRIGRVRACKTGPVHLPIEVISRVNAISSARSEPENLPRRSLLLLQPRPGRNRRNRRYDPKLIRCSHQGTGLHDVLKIINSSTTYWKGSQTPFKSTYKVHIVAHLASCPHHSAAAAPPAS